LQVASKPIPHNGKTAAGGGGGSVSGNGRRPGAGGWDFSFAKRLNFFKRRFTSIPKDCGKAIKKKPMDELWFCVGQVFCPQGRGPARGGGPAWQRKTFGRGLSLFFPFGPRQDFFSPLGGSEANFWGKRIPKFLGRPGFYRPANQNLLPVDRRLSWRHGWVFDDGFPGDPAADGGGGRTFPVVFRALFACFECYLLPLTVWPEGVLKKRWPSRMCQPHERKDSDGKGPHTSQAISWFGRHHRIPTGLPWLPTGRLLSKLRALCDTLTGILLSDDFEKKVMAGFVRGGGPPGKMGGGRQPTFSASQGGPPPEIRCVGAQKRDFDEGGCYMPASAP